MWKVLHWRDSQEFRDTNVEAIAEMPRHTSTLCRMGECRANGHLELEVLHIQISPSACPVNRDLGTEIPACSKETISHLTNLLASIYLRH